MYRSRRNSVRMRGGAPFPFGRVRASPSFGASDASPSRSRASASARGSSVAPGGASVPRARRASRTRASHDSGAAAVAPSPAAARSSRPAAASHHPDGSGATSAPGASPATPRARMHATHAASASARRARARAAPRLRRIAAVTRAGLPKGRRVRARLSREREIRSAFRVFTTETTTSAAPALRSGTRRTPRGPRLFASVRASDKKMNRNLVCVSVRIYPNAKLWKRTARETRQPTEVRTRRY